MTKPNKTAKKIDDSVALTSPAALPKTAATNDSSHAADDKGPAAEAETVPPEQSGAMPGGTMQTLRSHLLGTLDDLRDRKNPMEPDRARAIASVAGILVDTAKVEVDYLRHVNNRAPRAKVTSPFLEPDQSVHSGASIRQIRSGIVERGAGFTRHTMGED